MNEESNNDLFGLRLNEQGIRYVRKFAILVKFVVLTGAISSLFLFIISVGRIIDPVYYDQIDFWENAYFNVYPYFTIILTILLLFQLYYYWKVKFQLEEAIENKNEIVFNESFKSLLQNAIWGLISGIASLIVATIDLLFWIKYY